MVIWSGLFQQPVIREELYNLFDIIFDSSINL